MSAYASHVRRLIGVIALIPVAGCATFEPLRSHLSSAVTERRDCAIWYTALDSAVEDAGVRDVQSIRLGGFPYLRVDRFSAALRDDARSDDLALEDLVDRLVEQDLTARSYEFANLPVERQRTLLASLQETSASAPMRRTRECALVLRGTDMADPALRMALLERLVIPDNYVTAHRVIGFYALTRIPFSAGVRRHFEEVRAAYRRDLSASAKGVVVRYSPPAQPRPDPGEAHAILERTVHGPLQVPEPDAAELDTLFAAYAPSFEIETTGDYDRPGALRWGSGSRPEVDAAKPVVYRQVAHTRYRGSNLLQLVYTIWFSARPPQVPDDLLAGALDGVVFRVTLAPDGSPLVYDTMHPCGCYHMFFTTPRAVLLPAPAAEPEWAFVPQEPIAPGPGERLVVRVASGTHYVERLYGDRADGLTRYVFRPYDELRALPQITGGTRSVFGPDGQIAGTDRPEAWLFWPMGVANAGSMRQWGNHATAFVGRRHFDDADLFERRFMLELK